MRWITSKDVASLLMGNTWHIQQSEWGEIDCHDNHADLDDRLVNILIGSESIPEITTDFEF